jgi:hypothetical protein
MAQKGYTYALTTLCVKDNCYQPAVRLGPIAEMSQRTSGLFNTSVPFKTFRLWRCF